MNFIELLLLAVGLSMDAFAVAVCMGLRMSKASIKKALIIGLYFGVFQAVMPLLGYLAATLIADKITAFDHWIAFGLLLFLGSKMIVGSFKKEGCRDRKCPEETCIDRECPGKPENAEPSLKPAKMLPFALATSIDALAVGISLAFLKVEIAPAVMFIGITTLVLSMIGVKIGSIFGSKIKSKAEILGGIILVLIGVKILLEHLTGIAV